MTWFVYTKILTALVILAMGVWVLTINRISVLNRIYFCFSCLVSLWAVSEFFVAIQLSESSAVHWLQINYFIWPLAIASLLHLGLAYIGIEKLAWKARFLLYGPPLLTGLLALLPGNRLGLAVMRMDWAWNEISIATPFTIAIYIWAGICALSTLGLFIYRFLRPAEQRQKIQSLWLLVGFAAPILTGVVNGIVFPIITQDAHILNYSIQSCIFGFGVMAYAIWRHEIFGVSLKVASEQIFSMISDPVLVLDNDGQIAFANPAACFLLGTPEASLEKVDFSSRCVLEHPESKEYVWKRADGRALPMTFSRSVVKNKFGAPIGTVILGRDLTGHRETEKRLNHAQQLESIAVLAGGIAHDFNNFLQTFSGYMELMQMSLSTGDIEGTSNYLSKMMPVIKRSQSLTQQLLTYAKGGAPVRKIQKMDSVILETVNFALSGSKIRPILELEPDLWPCNVDAQQIAQVIDNMVINARESMPDGGTIQISAVNLSTSFAPEFIPVSDYIKISIRDEGAGIAPEHLPNIFLPFYTTKKNGSGLGLATCHSIVTKHEGMIEVDSALGKGTTFHVYLPASRTALPSSSKNSNRHRFSGAVLLMDDEVSIRESVSVLLAKLGFAVVTVSDGDEAVSMTASASASSEPISVAILDLTIPGGKGGAEIVPVLRAIAPEIRLIAISGYAKNHVMESPVESGFDAALAKPFSFSKLEETLKKVL